MQSISNSIYLLLFVLMLPITSCIDDNSLCGKEPDQEDGITIEFSLQTRIPARLGTRALLDPTGITQETGSEAENYLDLDNLTFLLFDKDMTLLQTLSPYVEADNPVSNRYSKYKVTAFLSNHYFLRATEDELTFSIVVLGNYQSLSPTRFGFAPGQKIRDIFDPNKVGSFAMPISNNNGYCWIPSITGGANGQTAGYIPMSGMQTFTVKTDDLRSSSPGNPLVLSTDENGKDINMMRSLAKIEIVDKIGFANNVQPDKNNRSWIEKVELVGHTTRGSIFPTLDQWNLTDNPFETQYVQAVSSPSDNAYVGAQPINGLTTENENAIVNFFEESVLRIDGCPVFSCYLTEYSPNERGSVYPMWMRVTVHGPGNAGSSSTLYRLDPAPYVDNVPQDLLSILRNNIYRYEITGIGTELNLNFVVDDWDSKETNWEYSDNLAMTDDGYLTWEPNPDITVTTSNAEVVIGNGSTLVGKFNFEEPKGGTWKASFVPVSTEDGETELDAFMFVDAEGKNPSSSITGKIDGNPATIRIIASMNPTTFNRKARLMFTVTTELGERTITADVLDDNIYGNNTYFTIVQNASL